MSLNICSIVNRVSTEYVEYGIILEVGYQSEPGRKMPSTDKCHWLSERCPNIHSLVIQDIPKRKNLAESSAPTQRDNHYGCQVGVVSQTVWCHRGTGGLSRQIISTSYNWGQFNISHKFSKFGLKTPKVFSVTASIVKSTIQIELNVLSCLTHESWNPDVLSHT